MKRFLEVVIAVLACQAAGLVGSLFTAPAIPAWYAGLNKPSFNPPSWLFAPVWTSLYTLMGIAAYLVWSRGGDRKEVKSALILFAVHLVLNALWSVIFFGWQKPWLAFGEIVLLWLAIILVFLRFYKLYRPAALLLIPYLLWVSFASFLNFSIARLN